MTLRRRRLATGCCVAAVAAAVLVIGETMVVRAHGGDARYIENISWKNSC